MSEPVGKKLAQVRAKRGLSLDEVAHATRLRPEQIVALENDDHTGFPSNAYAKGFLKNYARYLEVDVSDFLRTIDSTLPITVADYQYLINAPRRPVETESARRDRRPPSLLPILAGFGVLTLLVLGFWVYTSAQRIFAPPAPRLVMVAPPPAAPTLPPIAPDLAVPSTLSLEPAPADAAPAEMHPPAPAADDHTVLTPAASVDPADHDVVTPLPIGTGDPAAPVSPASYVNEILVATVKKTWVVVRRDDPKAPPIFEDYVYPDTRPLRLRGTRFFIESRNPDAVQITKNGLPIAYQAPGVPIQ